MNQISNCFVIMQLLVHPFSPHCCKIHLEFNFSLIICSILVSVSLLCSLAGLCATRENASSERRCLIIDNTHPRLEHCKLTQDLFTGEEGCVIGLVSYNTLIFCCYHVHFQLQQALQQHVHHSEPEQWTQPGALPWFTCAIGKPICLNWLLSWFLCIFDTSVHLNFLAFSFQSFPIFSVPTHCSHVQSCGFVIIQKLRTLLEDFPDLEKMYVTTDYLQTFL